jgi:uncharacterized protein YkwD
VAPEVDTVGGGGRPAKRAQSIVAPLGSRGGRAALAAIAACIGLIGPVSQPASGRPAAAPSPASTSVHSLLRLLNEERSKRGLRPLRQNLRLDKAARGHARDMVARGYFAHQRVGGPDFVARIRRTGYLSGAKAWAVGENIAYGEGNRSGVQSVVRAWMASRGHRSNILSTTYKDVGIGVVVGSPHEGRASVAVDAPVALTITTDFGRRFRVR